MPHECDAFVFIAECLISVGVAA